MRSTSNLDFFFSRGFNFHLLAAKSKTLPFPTYQYSDSALIYKNSSKPDPPGTLHSSLPIGEVEIWRGLLSASIFSCWCSQPGNLARAAYLGTSVRCVDALTNTKCTTDVSDQVLTGFPALEKWLRILRFSPCRSGKKCCKHSRLWPLGGSQRATCMFLPIFSLRTGVLTTRVLTQNEAVELKGPGAPNIPHFQTVCCLTRTILFIQAFLKSEIFHSISFSLRDFSEPSHSLHWNNLQIH